MLWYGKILGTVCGYLVAGPLGAALGFVVGHSFDLGLTENLRPHRFTNFDLAKVHYTFFKIAFMVMGYVAKSGGHVTEKQIAAARSIMHRLGLNKTLKQQAIHFFNQGKQADFKLRPTLLELQQTCGQHRELLRIFIEMQIETVIAEGRIAAKTRYLLHDICYTLGFNFTEFEIYTNPAEQEPPPQQNQQYRQSQQRRQHYTAPPPPVDNSLKRAYAILQIPETATDNEVKKAYRKLMSQHHPDKLIAKGLPEEMMKLATAKTQQIRAAYEEIRSVRGH